MPLTMHPQAYGFDDGPEGLSAGERLQMLQDCLDRGELGKLERFSPQELYDALLTRGQCDDEVVRYIRIAQELGSVFLHPGMGSTDAEEDDVFLSETLSCVFPELAEDEAQP